MRDALMFAAVGAALAALALLAVSLAGLAVLVARDLIREIRRG